MAEELRPPFDPHPLPPAALITTSSPTISSANTPHNATTAVSTSTASSSPSAVSAALISLPAIAGPPADLFLPSTNIPRFLTYELDLSRLNRIHAWLWMAGRPMRARPLHRYRMMGFSVLQTEKMDLHLVRFSSKLLVKPVAEYMLSWEFWDEWICGNGSGNGAGRDNRNQGGDAGHRQRSPWHADSTSHSDERRASPRELHEAACGFLLSHVWLVTTPLDLQMAKDLCLLPPSVTWPWWKCFVADLLSHVDANALDAVNPRFHFGDLRLSRINSIYRTRYALTHFVRGYLYGYNRYVAFFQRNFSWILILSVFISLVLAAMQVGVSLDLLSGNAAFIRASYGFVIFSMVAVAAVMAVVGAVFAFVWVFNMFAAIGHVGKAKRERRRRIEERQRSKEA